MCSSERPTRRKYCGAYITAIDDEEIVTLDQAKEKFAELHSKKVESFTMILAREPKPSKAMTRRVYDELELPEFDLNDNLGEDYFAPGEDLEDKSSMTSSQKTVEFGTSVRITCRQLEPRSARISGPKDTSREKWCRVPIMLS